MKNKRNERLTFIRCPLCGKDDSRDYLWFDEYRYVQCLSCGLIYQNPQPGIRPLHKRYSKKYFQYEFRNQRNFFNLMRLTLRDIRFSDKLAREFPEKTRTFLDIGCATGLLLNHVRQQGWKVKGLELDTYSVRYARRIFSLDILNQPLEEAELPDRSFNVIHWSHVIEHLPDPFQGLKKIYSLLKPGGYMLLTTPRIDSFQHYLFQKEWRSFHRDHLTIFSGRTLKQMVRKAGFGLIRSFSWGGLAADKEHPLKPFKRVIDKAVKTFNTGDVIFILAKKKINN
ncbi:MAG: class I SAM-dependent methyltransferase [bacterium]|nr:class I SAM-dependent methyltransferase [bacterium]